MASPFRLRQRHLIIGGAAAYLVVLVFLPVGAIFHGAVSDGFGPILSVLRNPEAQHALFLTLAVAAVVIVVNTVLGVATAFALTRDRFPGRRILNALCDVPFAVSPVVAGLMLLLLYGRTGWLGPLAERLDLRIAFAVPGMILATAFVSLPFVVREVSSVLSEVGPQDEEAARVLGANAWQAFLHVTLPNIRWGLFNGIALVTARCLGEFGAVLVVSGALTGRTETATLWIFHALEERREGEANVMALVLALFSVGLLVLMEIIKRRQEKSA